MRYMMEEKKKHKGVLNINVVDIIGILRKDRRKLLIYSLTAGVIGVLLAFATPKEYKSTVILAPEESGKGFSGSISSIASMIGMNMKLGQTGDAIYPEIYPDLMQSTQFVVDLFPITVTKDKTGEKYSYFEYLQHHQKTAFYDYPLVLAQVIVEKLRGDAAPGPGHKVDAFRLTRKEYDVVKGILGNISCQVDKKTNVITIVVSDQDPLIAATVADSVKSHLQRAITDYRTKKARNDLEYMEGLYARARSEYDRARQAYAAYADANQDVILQSYRLKEEDLENEMQLKYNIYQTVVEQLQLAQAKVQENTPAFTTLQQASVPVKHSNRPKIVVLIIWMFLGFILRASILAWKHRTLFVNL